METALIVFAKNLQLGKVKTRLAATLGDFEGLRIYKLLLNYTYKICEDVNADKFIFYSNYIQPEPPHNFFSRMQYGNDLGERMRNAFAEIFDSGYRKVVIIGSDTLEVTAEIINRAFAELDSFDVVLGPATDGGYYLLGMKSRHNFLFENIPWSTPKVLAQSLEQLKLRGLQFTLLPELNDIDDEQDWRNYLAKQSLHDQHRNSGI